MATDHVVEEGEVVMDSLGQMKKLSKWAIFENQVIHRCYAWWMIGVLTDHYMRCAIDMDSDNQYYPFCTTLARTAVKPWSEILVRSLGNDQDLFGFIMLGAYQDSRPATPGGPPSVKFGMKDFFVFIVYMAMALPLPQILHFIFREYAWPIDWGGGMEPTNEWGWSYMQVNSYTSDHRWYLGMVFCVRVFCQIPQLKVPADGPSPSTSAKVPCNPECSILKANYIQIPGFHYPNNVLEKGTGMARASAARRRGGAWAWLEIGVDILQPTLFVWTSQSPDSLPPGITAFQESSRLGMTYVPFDLAWRVFPVGVEGLLWLLVVTMGVFALHEIFRWGNTTLGAYVFHFYFRDHAAA
ncbi:unnamed protein product [Symbiodinium sp. CCMP2592]|nr:unnamed protein product [Symbiodinium sp. CCMP2592]